jgi:hypothetical protein
MTSSHYENTGHKMKMSNYSPGSELLDIVAMVTDSLFDLFAVPSDLFSDYLSKEE